MQGAPGVDFPEERSPVDVMAASRGDALMCFVERVGDDDLLLTVGQDRSRRAVRLSAGERLELVWKDAGELRALPAELVGVGTSEQPLWRVRPVGPAARGQRRAAVRAPMPFRVVLQHGGLTAEGTTVDLSEGGVRAWFDLSVQATGTEQEPDEEAQATSRAPEVGAVVDLTVWFADSDSVAGQAEVSRQHERTDRRSELSLRFIGLSEKQQDRVRREVFAGLRALHARGAL